MSYELFLVGGFETHCKDNTSMIGNVRICPQMSVDVLICLYLSVESVK